MGGPTMWGRGRIPALVTAAALLLTGSGVVAAQAVLPEVSAITGALGLGPAPGPAAPASTPTGGYLATASGAVVHAGTLANLLSIDVARSAAGAAEEAARPAAGDLGRAEVPTIPAGGSYAHGVGLVTGLGSGDLSTSQAGPTAGAEATAPPNRGAVRREGTPLDVLGLVRGALLRAEAQARAAQTGCVVGSDLSHATGEAGDVTLVGAASMGDAGLPLSHSTSRTVIVPGEAGRLAMRSETRQRISPITFLAGTPAQFSIHTEGEWMLRAEADGHRGTLVFGPADTGSDGIGRSVRVVDSSGRVLAAGSPAGNGTGLRLEVAGLAEIVVGEAPRAPGSAASAVVTGQRVSAAVDLVRVRLLGQDLRIGHMEVDVTVPAQGVECPRTAAVLNTPAGTVEPGTEFPVKVQIVNPNDGVLTVPAVTARFAADGAGFELVADDGGEVVGATLTWPGLTVPAGAAVERRARVRVAPQSGPGTFRVEVNGDGSYGPEPGAPAGSGAVIPVAVRAAADGPTVAALPLVPEVVGRGVVEARSVLEAAGYHVAVEERPGGGVPGVVIGQHPTGRAPAGSLVTLVVPAAAPPKPAPVAPPKPAATPPRVAAVAPAPEPPAPEPPATPAEREAPGPAPVPPVAVPAPEESPAPPAQAAPVPEREPRPAPGGDDDENLGRWLWGLVALALIAAVGTAARRNRA